MRRACRPLTLGATMLGVACQPPPEGHFDGECADGADNDRNGLTDCEEAQCDADGCTVPCINEFMAVNVGTIADDHGDTSDWIELHNPGRGAVSLAGYAITDDLADPDKHRFKVLFLAGGGHRVLWASDRVDAGAEHLPFKLSGDGGELGLFRPNGEPIQQITYEAQTADWAAALVPDCGPDWSVTDTPTPGAANGRP